MRFDRNNAKSRLWCSMLGMRPIARIYVHVAIAAALGAGYGLWGLEAASPLAIPLILWAVLVLLLVWRMPPRLVLFIGCVVAFVVGFGLVWTVVLGRLLAACKPPSCQTADAATDVFYAAAVLGPLIVVGTALFAVRKLILHR
jgi:hypothetical protein